MFLSGYVASLAVLQLGVSAQNVISSDTYFYGDSPPVYPSPQSSGLGNWAAAYNKAKALVGQMTLSEKVNLTAGYVAPNGCSGAISAVSRLGFPGLCFADAGNGVRNTDFVNAWPSGLHVGASWNKQLAQKRGAAMAMEFKKKGANMLLGPVVSPLGRVVEGGRNWEGFTPDPYLAGSLTSSTVNGTQSSGVIASTKHFIGYEQETNRNPSGNISSYSSNIDDATLHELYLWPFQDALRAGTGNIMCSYNKVNNSYACQNSKMLNGILKTELGFQGFVVSDWYGLHAGHEAALAGLDMVMPYAAPFWGDNLVESVKNGSVPESRIDDMAIRTISAWYQMHQDQGFLEPGVGIPADVTLPHTIVDARDDQTKPLLFQGAVEGHVLVKNINNALPLQKPKMLSVFGYSAKAPDHAMPVGPEFSVWGRGYDSASVDFDALVKYRMGHSSKIPQIAINGTIISGGGSGTTALSTFISPWDALVYRAVADGTELYWNFNTPDPVVMQMSDACLVMGNAFSSEAFDRSGVRDQYTDGLVLSVAEQCANTIVILQNAGTRLVDAWIDHPNVTAVIFAHLPGQETGRALVSLLYGESQFSGRLPYTVGKKESDYGDLLSPTLPSGRFELFPQVYFAEGVYIDYRHFDREDIDPRFEFGFGLSYTTFNYKRLGIETAHNSSYGPYPVGPVVQGGHVDLWDVLARVSLEVENTGSMDAPEVVQLYAHIPGGPKKQLRGFEKPMIKAGSSASVEFQLTRRDLSVWDTVAQKWKLQKGPFDVFVGSSSRDLPLHGSFRLG